MNKQVPTAGLDARLSVSAVPTPANGARMGDFTEAVHGILRRRWKMMAAILLLVLLPALGAIALMPAKYDATVRVRLDPSRNPMAQDQAQSALNAEAIETEIGVMTSLDLAREVVQRLHLDQDPEFAVGDDGDTLANPTEKLNDVARRLMRNVNVNRDQLSYIIALSVRSRQAQKSATIANSFADAYIDMRVNTRQGTSLRQAEFFQNSLATLAQKLNEADARVAAYRAQAGMSDSATAGTIVDQQIAPLSVQYATAQSDAARAASNARIAQSQVAAGHLDAVPGVQESNVIRDLRAQRADIVRNLGEVNSRYGPKHPESIRVTRQVASIDQQITEEAQRIVTALQAEASAKAAQTQSLRVSMDDLKAQRANNTRASAMIERLTREAASIRAQYDKMSDMSLASTQTMRSSIAQAEIVDRAQPPSSPTSPKKPLLAALACVTALALALGGALVREMGQGGFRSVAEIEEQFGLPVIASLPLVPRKGKLFDRDPPRSPADSIGVGEATIYGEAVRNLLMSLVGTGRETAPRIVAFTSALPNEGKTTSSLSFARMAAINGKSVLLIDCDLRNAKLRLLTNGQHDKGVVEVLRGQASLASATVPDQVDGLSLLTVSSPLFTSQDIFGDGAMESLLTDAGRVHDLVILDLPPVLGVADARTLSMLADLVAFVVHWGKTPPQAVRAALSVLRSDNVALAGVAFTMVDPNAEAAGASYYSRSYSKYYLS